MLGADAFTTATWVVGAIGIIAGAVGAISTFRKTKPETTGILVDASKEVVLIQGTLLDRIQAQLAEALARLAVVEADAKSAKAEALALKEEVAGLRKENASLKGQLTAARKRITELEK